MFGLSGPSLIRLGEFEPLISRYRLIGLVLFVSDQCVCKFRSFNRLLSCLRRVVYESLSQDVYSGNHSSLLRKVLTSWLVMISTSWSKSTKASNKNRSLMNVRFRRQSGIPGFQTDRLKADTDCSCRHAGNWLN